MTMKIAKTKGTKATGANRGQVIRPVLAVEDDERHLEQADDYISRNRDALNASIRRSRKEIADGKISTTSIDAIIAAGRRRHGS